MSDGSTNPSRPDNGGDDETVRSQYDWSTISPSTAVVETVAVAVDRETTELDTLYDSLEPDALDTLIQKSSSSPALSPVRVTFTFADRHIVVDSEGEIVVEPGV